MSEPDRDTESGYAYLIREITGQPLVGMTLATGNNAWSARHWDLGTGRGMDCSHCTNVRVVRDRLAVSWNDELRPPPASNEKQVRSVSAWGERCQADLARPACPRGRCRERRPGHRRPAGRVGNLPPDRDGFRCR